MGKQGRAVAGVELTDGGTEGRRALEGEGGKKGGKRDSEVPRRVFGRCVSRLRRRPQRRRRQAVRQLIERLRPDVSLAPWQPARLGGGQGPT